MVGNLTDGHRNFLRFDHQAVLYGLIHRFTVIVLFPGDDNIIGADIGGSVNRTPVLPISHIESIGSCDICIFDFKYLSCSVIGVFLSISTKCNFRFLHPHCCKGDHSLVGLALKIFNGGVCQYYRLTTAFPPHEPVSRFGRVLDTLQHLVRRCQFRFRCYRAAALGIKDNAVTIHYYFPAPVLNILGGICPVAYAALGNGDRQCSVVNFLHIGSAPAHKDIAVLCGVSQRKVRISHGIIVCPVFLAVVQNTGDRIFFRREEFYGNIGFILCEMTAALIFLVPNIISRYIVAVLRGVYQCREVVGRNALTAENAKSFNIFTGFVDKMHGNLGTVFYGSVFRFHSAQEGAAADGAGIFDNAVFGKCAAADGAFSLIVNFSIKGAAVYQTIVCYLALKAAIADGAIFSVCDLSCVFACGNYPSILHLSFENRPLTRMG